MPGKLPRMPRRIGNPARRRRHFIKEWREFRGLSQEQLAFALDTTTASISRIEALKTGYTQDFLEACADALGTHPAMLLTRAPNDSDAEPHRTAGAAASPKRPGQRK
jgi:transcriptional regulator with XRE-family HTH domain